MAHLVGSLRDRLPNRFDGALQVLERTDNPALDELQFRRDGILQFYRGGLVRVDVEDDNLRVWVFPKQVDFACHGSKEDCEMVGDALPGRE